MKHLKLYENWTQEQLSQLHKEKTALELKEKDVKNLIDEFLNYNRHLLNDKEDWDWDHYITDFQIYKFDNAYIDYYTENDEGEQSVVFAVFENEKDYNNLISFLENPDMYRDAKKYNL